MSAYTPPFLLIRANGETTEFATLADLAVHTRANKIKVADYHVRQITEAQNRITVVRDEWIVRDDFGQIVDRYTIKAALPKHRYYWDRRHDLLRHYESLGLPLPNIGRCFRGYSNILRDPRHLAARRDDADRFSYADEMGPHHVARLRVKRPPSNWDDIPRSNWNVRSWKHYRAFQYKPVGD